MSEAYPETPSPEMQAPYTLGMVARITRISEEEIIIYYRAGVITAPESTDESQLFFDESAIHQLRRIARLLSEYEMNRAGLEMVSSLWREVESLRTEVRFLREKN